MSKRLNQNKLRGRMSVHALVVTMSLSLAAFGCTTNHYRSAGEPVTMAPAGGSVAPSLSTTPGSAGPAIPSTMISAAVDPSLDAVAVLEANRGFQGRVLGPAAPGPGPSMSAHRPTGQFISPALLADAPQTIRTSLSSQPVPAIVSGSVVGGVAVETPGAGVLIADSVASPVSLSDVGDAATNANFGVTGLSNTTATGLTNTTLATTSASSVMATPTFGTVGRLNVDNTAIARSAATPVRVETTSGRVTVTNAGSTSNP